MKKFKCLKAGQVDLVVYDFDGVMTDNRAFLLEDGTEGVFVSRADGFGVKLLRDLGIAQIILSMETNTVVRARGEKLQIDVIGGCDDKKKALTEYCRRKKYDLSKVVYIGNDVNDLDVMQIVGVPVCPADAHARVKAIAQVVLKTRGGYGVVKEFVEQYIKS